jgi:hypothetical protein
MIKKILCILICSCWLQKNADLLIKQAMGILAQRKKNGVDILAPTS